MAYFTRETGIMSIFTGMVIFCIGFFMLFDRAVMIAGNFIVIFGLFVLTQSNAHFFLRMSKIQGVVLFVTGMVLLLFKYTFLGFLLEIFGLLLVFKNSIPDIKTVLKNYAFGKPLYKTE